MIDYNESIIYQSHLFLSGEKVKDKNLTFKAKGSLIEELKSRALERDRSVSYLIREALKLYLEAEPIRE